jgi:hypothetical protein
MTIEEVSTATVYCKTLDEVLQEVAKRRASKADGVITRYEASPYGGYRVYSVEADAFVDEFADPVLPNARRDSFRLYR